MSEHVSKVSTRVAGGNGCRRHLVRAGAEAAEAGTGVTLVVNGNDQNVSYTGENGQIYEWLYGSKLQWGNKEL